MDELSQHKIQLENYYGPLDLLLHLVKENEMDIYNISISKAAEQYIAYIGMMQKMDINLAGEFLVMASTLMLIKSRTLVPSEITEEEEEEEDPRMELVKKLLEYKKFKDRARMFGQLIDRRSRMFGRPDVLDRWLKDSAPAGHETEIPAVKLNSWDLCSSYAKISKATGFEVPYTSILYNDMPIEKLMETILHKIKETGSVLFSTLIDNWEDKGKIVGNLLASLELAKQKYVRIEQESNFADIKLTAHESIAPAPPPQTATPSTQETPAL
ncbi:MAG: segregation/condensation protein A [Planctomycetes bacterium]|nr:segregation/condensation protein A [Planctomycetota bacterium]